MDCWMSAAVAIAAPFGLPRDYGQRPVVEPPKPPVPAVDQARAKAALEGAQAARPGHARATALLEKMAAPTKARKKAS